MNWSQLPSTNWLRFEMKDEITDYCFCQTLSTYLTYMGVGWWETVLRGDRFVDKQVHRAFQGVKWDILTYRGHPYMFFKIKFLEFILSFFLNWLGKRSVILRARFKHTNSHTHTLHSGLFCTILCTFKGSNVSNERK